MTIMSETRAWAVVLTDFTNHESLVYGPYESYDLALSAQSEYLAAVDNKGDIATVIELERPAMLAERIEYHTHS